MVKDNPTWGAPRIHGELLKLGFDVSERTVSRYIRRLSPRKQAPKLWAAFLQNHREVIAAMDFFTVPTLTFRVLYRFFVIEHGRRKTLHFNVTEHPTDRSAIEGSFPGILSLPLWDSGSRREVRQMCDGSAGIQRHQTQANQFLMSLAKWNLGAMDWQLPPRASRPCDHN